MPTGHSADAIAELFAKGVDEAADINIGVPGLIRKYFGRSDGLRSVVGIYCESASSSAVLHVVIPVQS